MLTKFITEVTTVFNPFSPKAKTARLFLSFIPAGARRDLKVSTKLLPRASKEPSVLQIKFKDGKDIKLNPEILGINGVLEEVNRHSRILAREEELTGR